MIDLLQKAVDHIDEGIIIVDQQGIVQVYNQKARSIFALDTRVGPGHPAGTIQRGDIVVVADSTLGHDDGGLTAGDLALIGVDPTGIRPGDSIVAIGTYGAKPGTAIWKTSSGLGMMLLEVCTTLENFKHVKARIDCLKKSTTIAVGSEVFEIPYQISIGHMVLISPSTLTVRFYQSRGYSERGEDLRSILHGGSYVAKGPDVEAPDPVGRHILEVHPHSISTQHLMRVIKGECDSVPAQEYPINGVPVRCTVTPLFGPSGQVGGLLKLEDMSTVKYLERQLQYSVVKPAAFSQIAGSSHEIIEVVRVAERASQTKSTVLLLGESGTGKGLMAKCIHQSSPRCNGPFISVNLGAIPSTLAESELFGYEDGAFTGARKRGKPGLFQLADGGTLFLDEIGEADPMLQVKLLHALQEGCVRPVGGVEPVPVDVRIIAATNRNLEEWVKEGRFREDLFYRLNVVALTLPPLRQRRVDIPELAADLLPVISSRVGKEVTRIDTAAMNALTWYNWPGNVRELENVLERACNMTDSDTIKHEHLPDSIQGLNVGQHQVARLDAVLEAAERQALIEALKAAGQNRTKAMKMLGLSRTTFYAKLAKYQLG